MAEIIQEEKGKGGKKRAKKVVPHIDMTPMVDLMCLLITFFMLANSLNKAKIMEIVLPDRLNDPNQEAPRISASRTQNIILGPENKIYTYPGTVKPEDFNNLPPLRETDFSATGIRQILLGWNKTLFKKIADFNQQVISGKIEISQDSVRGAISHLKKVDDTGPIVLIKAYKEANYGNFVDILDEMNICGIAVFMFVDITWYEEKMVEAAMGVVSTSATSSN
ncbi:MAG: biopolymer transporter ExbD [Bacteroidia bacterium]|nr:biopolymer transporter ExbD [Bacteroidia bacterium]